MLALKAIDLVDECCANLTATRDTRPEAIDVLERRKLQLEVEIRALKVSRSLQCEFLPVSSRVQTERDRTTKRFSTQTSQERA